MKVFYPVSESISDLINGESHTSAGFMPLWGLVSVGVLALVLIALPDFGGEHIDVQHEQHELLSSQQFNRPAHFHSTQAKHCHHRLQAKGKATTQDYIDAHRCAQSVGCWSTVKVNQLVDAPTKSKAGADLYL